MSKVEALESSANDKSDISEIKSDIKELKKSIESLNDCCLRVEEKELCQTNEVKAYVHDKIHKLIDKYKNHKHKDVNDRLDIFV